jgi:hypothetical protein
VVEQAGKAAGTKIVLKDYVRFQLGEGIEKEETDFAAEVAAARSELSLRFSHQEGRGRVCARPFLMNFRGHASSPLGIAKPSV